MLDYAKPSTPSSMPSATLARRMGLFSLIVYGIGDMVGSGIYATVGVAAGQMGNAVWLGFAASMVAALLTGMSYASIASRYPRAAGAAFVTHHAYRLPFLSYLVGLTVTASGLTSMGTASNAFAKTFTSFAPKVPIPAIIIVFLLLMTFINFWGIRESMWTNLLCTAVEVGGLVFIIAVGARYWGSVDYTQVPDGRSILDPSSWQLMLTGAVLTFYSFVGFEDMLNVAEEVKDPQRNMPWGMVIALLAVTVLYIVISITAVSVVDWRELKASASPLSAITGRAAPWLPAWVFTAITLFAVANTALINYIMGSRMVYGMARQGLVPRPLGVVHPTRRTPHVAILTLMGIVIVLALSGGISDLASATSLLLLGCFAIVNSALIILQRRPGEPRGQFEVPMVVPLLGALVCLGLIVNRLVPKDGEPFQWKAPAIAAGLGVGITLLYLIMRPKNITEESLAAAEDAAG